MFFFLCKMTWFFVDEVRLWLWPVCRIQSMLKYHLGSLVGDGKSRNSYLLCLWNKIIITLINLCTCIIRFQFWRREPAKPTPMQQFMFSNWCRSSISMNWCLIINQSYPPIFIQKAIPYFNGLLSKSNHLHFWT